MSLKVVVLFVVVVDLAVVVLVVGTHSKNLKTKPVKLSTGGAFKF